MFFLPTSNTLISCFKDDSVFAWDCDTMKCLYQLNSPTSEKPMYKCLAATKDSRILAAAGRLSHCLPCYPLLPRLLMRELTSSTMVFNLIGGVEPQGCIIVARGTPFSYICIGELEYTVDRSISMASGGAPALCWRNPRVPRNPI